MNIVLLTLFCITKGKTKKPINARWQKRTLTAVFKVI